MLMWGIYMYNRQIDTFIQVVDSKSFARASKRMIISTVSIMKQINALEASVGVKLLDRTTQGVVPTAAGRSFYAAAKEIIRLSEQSIRQAREIARAERYTIRIGSSRLHPYIMMQEKLAALDLDSLPFHIQIVPFQEEDLDLTGKLKMLGQEFDCFISPYDGPRWAGEYSVIHLKKVPCRLTLPRNHRLAKKGRLTLEDLHGETLLLHKQGAFSGFDALRARIEAEHPEIKLLDFPAYSTETFNLCARKGCLMMSLDIWEHVHPSLVTLPADWDCALGFGLIYPKKPSKEMLEFLEYLG